MNWNEILGTAHELANKFRLEGSVAWFRGHRKSDFELSSTIHRHVDRIVGGLAAPPDDLSGLNLLCEEYKTAYRRFKADAWPLLDPRERSHWGIVFTLQHYGLPTRLLDWTESFACAVFFAQWRRRRNEEAEIWVLDPQSMNKVACGQEGLLTIDEDSSRDLFDLSPYHPRYVSDRQNTTLPTLAVSPLFTSPRMTAQRAAFTLSGNSRRPLNIEFPELVSAGRLVRLPLPPSTFDDAAIFLQLAGITPFSFFPDMQGLAMRHESEVENRLELVQRFYSRE